ncbi:MAG: NADAR family protein, partial [Bdellovibrionales bacterium]|nr:NADAR family protein [Bdellovibrionales bacterium]
TSPEQPLTPLASHLKVSARGQNPTFGWPRRNLKMKHSWHPIFFWFCILAVFSAGCTATQTNRVPAQSNAQPPLAGDPYPPHWWAKIDRGTQVPPVPAWEILPHEVEDRTKEVILSKRNELGILSNFAATPFTFEGEKFASMEGFWQATKFPEGKDDERNSTKVTWKFTREQVKQMVAFEAKAAGDHASSNMKKLGIDWVSFQGKKMVYREPGDSAFYQLIYKAMEAKLMQTELVRVVLMRTGNLILKPDHKDNENGAKAWRYYEIWMQLRSEEANRTKRS